MSKSKTDIHPLHETVIYILSFIFTLHITPTVYIDSSYLNTFIGEKWVGLIFSFSSLMVVICLIFIRPILRQVGNYNIFINILIIECFALIGLSIGTYPILVVLSYILHFVAVSLSYFNLDIFLAKITKKKNTGTVRGIYLTSANVAYVIGPLLTGFIVANNFYQIVYALGIVLLIPVINITKKYGPSFHDPNYEKPEILKTAKKILFINDDVHRIFGAGLILQIFYSVMVIYTPIYLHTHIGFNWLQIGALMSVALMAFVLFEALFGFIADKWLGEKEILITGFIITAISTGFLSFMTTSTLWIWMAIVFLTRFGACMIESMTETYVFKKVNASNINVLSLYRMISPTSYIIAPIFVSIFLNFLDLKYIFVVLGIFCLLGIYFSFRLKDTL